jgi:hypothetical protein
MLNKEKDGAGAAGDQQRRLEGVPSQNKATT